MPCHAQSIGQAYEVLSNPEKKAQYDQGVEVEDLDNPHAGHEPSHGHGGGHGGGGASVAAPGADSE